MIPDRLPLIVSPTPVHRLDRLSNMFGVDLWLKRDDLTGFALGGNKGRKLEYLLPDVLNQKADVVVTSGASQSNFLRQLAAACRMYGVKCVAATMKLPYDGPAGKPDAAPMGDGGNKMLSQMLGAEIHEYPDGVWEDLYDRAEELAREFESKGQKVYRMPSGGSSALGAFAFRKAGEELQAQLQEIDAIVFATSSGSTQAGLAYAYRGSKTRIVGICADPEPEFVDYVADLTNELETLTGRRRKWTSEDLECHLDWVGPGYGVPSEGGDLTTEMLLMAEGIFLDPIYTAKAFEGLVHLTHQGELPGRIVFWHTGGIPALFARS